jgi:hypothetical protein
VISNAWSSTNIRVTSVSVDGWLMISDTPNQSAGEIAAVIGASRASLTTSMRLLIAIGLVRSVTRPRERTIYYRTDDDAWEKMLRRRIASMASFRAITKDGLALLGDDKQRAARIRTVDQVYEWAESIFAAAPPCPVQREKNLWSAKTPPAVFSAM